MLRSRLSFALKPGFIARVLQEHPALGGTSGRLTIAHGAPRRFYRLSLHQWEKRP